MPWTDAPRPGHPDPVSWAVRSPAHLHSWVDVPRSPQPRAAAAQGPHSPLALPVQPEPQAEAEAAAELAAALASGLAKTEEAHA